MVSDGPSDEAELVARSIYRVVDQGGDLEAVLRRLLSLGPSAELLLEAARWSGAQDQHVNYGTWGVVASELAQAHELAPFQPHSADNQNQF